MKRDNNFIRKQADALLQGKLRNLFFQNNMNLKEHEASAGEDNGTDFYFDVTNENDEHGFFFRNQNKGTYNNLQIIKNKSDINFGKISHQISLRNATNYYTEFDEPIIFTLCDLKNEIIYWYDIQNDITLKERILNQKIKSIDAIQIYVPRENILNENIFNQFLNKIENAKLIQFRKKNILNEYYEADYSKIENQIKNKHIIDKIDFTINLFEGIKVLPIGVICKLPPFKGTDENKARISGFTFYIDDNELFDLLESFVLFDNQLKLKTNEVFVENQNQKLENIINFFLVNHIYHISWRGKGSRDQICIHTLFQYSECDCERCNLNVLNIKKTNEILNKISNDTSLYTALRKGYTYYLLGDYKSSVDTFYSLYDEGDRLDNPIKYTILTYNLSKLKILIKWSYYGDDEKEILEKLSVISFDIDEPLIKKKAPHFLEIFKNIKERRFYEDVKDTVDECFSEIQKISFGDKYGNTYSNNKYEDLKSSFLRFKSYLEHNFLIFNHYYEYNELAKKILESLFALYKLNNPLTDRYEKFDWIIIEMWIFKIDEKHSKYLLAKYNITKIIVDEKFEIPKKINKLVLNLIDSNEFLDNLEGLFKPIKIAKILGRILVITSLLEIQFEEKEIILSNILKLSSIIKNKHNIPFDELVRFIDKNENEISKTHIKEILDLFIYDDHSRYSFGRSINIYAEKSTEIEIENFIKSFLKIDDLKHLQIDLENRYFKKLFYLFTFLNQDLRENIRLKIIDSLQKKFNDELYGYAIIYDLIEFDEKLFKKYISTVPDMSTNEDEHYFNNYENIRLGQIINLVFKFNLKFDKELKNLLNKSHKKYYNYYSWLMDIDDFDYTNFNSYWILEYQTIYYFERFKKSEKLKAELAKSLKENYIEGVGKIFLENLV